MWTKIELKNGQYVNVPEPNRPVLAILRWSSGKEIPAVIKYVKADDHSWETVDDNSELSYSLDVIKWMYIPE
jgi:hypothetical protein